MIEDFLTQFSPLYLHKAIGKNFRDTLYVQKKSASGQHPDNVNIAQFNHVDNADIVQQTTQATVYIYILYIHLHIIYIYKKNIIYFWH